MISAEGRGEGAFASQPEGEAHGVLLHSRKGGKEKRKCSSTVETIAQHCIARHSKAKENNGFPNEVSKIT